MKQYYTRLELIGVARACGDRSVWLTARWLGEWWSRIREGQV